MPLTHFHPAVQKWFRERVGEPSAPQREGWPAIRTGQNVLIAAPTGTGKTLAAFLWAIDGLLREDASQTGTRILYVSPLKALGNDVQKNLQGPLGELRERDGELPEVRVLVRSGDTPQRERTAMAKRPPHILVTTPESLYILLTSDSGRAMLSTVKTVIIDEIHAIVGSKRGSHLALSLERLEALAGPVQRIGLSATQKPIGDVAHLLVGSGRECKVVDIGHLRELDIAIELPPSPLTAVCSHETWEEIYNRMAQLIGEHRTTLIFVNTRKMAERIAARLTKVLGAEQVTCHHGSLSRERRLAAEQRLKAGELRALVATASLELGIDIGEVDLVIQCGSTRSIAAFLQRVGRAGHGIGRIPKGRVFPLTQDELAEAAALLRAVRAGVLDRTIQPEKPMDILTQQIVAACVAEPWEEDTLYKTFTRAWPYRNLTRTEFDAAIALHTQGRHSLLHRDGVNGRLRATRRARLTAITSGGAIPDTADYRVVVQPEETFIGTVNEDFAIESNAGDIFQLGNASWRILKLEPGVLRVADAKGAPPTLPFWLGEAPGRTAELSYHLSRLREAVAAAGGESDFATRLECEIGPEALRQLTEYTADGRRVLGAVPTDRLIIAERFFDDSGGMQLVLHAPRGSRINRAWGLALRKRFCRHFGFELQAAANEEAILLSLGPQHSFPLKDVFDFLHPDSARAVLVQALLDAPMFKSRWRWNVSRALLLSRMDKGRRVPAPLTRMRADDLLVQAFPEVMACGENLPPGDLPVPMDHPLVKQTVDDCLTEAMDIDGFLALLRGLRDGSIETRSVDSPEPSAFARGILNAQPYSFLDDAPLEERRTQAVIQRRGLDQQTADELGALDPEAVERVREEAWPQPREAEEVHEALLWMGYVTSAEAEPWREWIEELRLADRVQLEGDRWFATEATRAPKAVLRGRMEALGPVFLDDPLLYELENDGCVLRVRLDGRQGWCDRRLLARIHRYTLDRLRREIEPVSASEFLRFLPYWQHMDEATMLDGPRGVAEVIAQLAGFDAPAASWEREILPRRVKDYRRDWIDQATLSGEVVWGRLWGGGASAVRATPICLVRREDLPSWLALAGRPRAAMLGAHGRRIHETLLTHGALFYDDLKRRANLLPDHLEMGIGELLGEGMATCDSFDGLRQLLTPPHKRRRRIAAAGRWSLFREIEPEGKPDHEFAAKVLLKRYGVIFRKLLAREKIPVLWRDLVRIYRSMELRGDVRGGRFVGGFSGEQYALPEAVETLRRLRREGREAPEGKRPVIEVAAADPLNLQGILTPEERVSSMTKRYVTVG